MLNKKQLIKEQKDCADMLGMFLKEYQEYVKDTKIASTKEENKNIIYDNSILKNFGVGEEILKKSQSLTKLEV